MTSRDWWRRQGCLFFALVVVATSCGGLQSSQHGGTGAGGSAASGAGSGGFATGGTSGGGARGSGGETSAGTCADAGAPVSTVGLPGEVGCYASTTSGWVRIPCDCELLIQNQAAVDVEVQVSLALSGSDVTPTLTGTSDIEVAFDDPDGSWFDTWTAQAATLDTFSVVRQGATTTVRLGAASVSLNAVSLGGCEIRAAEARMGGAVWSTALRMQAVLTDGTGSTVADLSGACSKPPRL